MMETIECSPPSRQGNAGSANAIRSAPAPAMSMIFASAVGTSAVGTQERAGAVSSSSAVLTEGQALFVPLAFDLRPLWFLFAGLCIDISTAVRDGLTELVSGTNRSQSAAAKHSANAIGGFSKRMFDIVVAGTALVLLSPIMLLVAALIKLTIGGPVVFVHQRVGFKGATFDCLKFRSMVLNGDEVLARHLANDPAAALEWRETRKLMNDPRVTPLGKLLRKSSLDELPQLFNVLRGDMSCVGPRPIVMAEIERYGSRAHYYLSVRPGVTGLWQVSGRSRLTYRQRVALDCLYVSNHSILLDTALLFKTIPAVLAFEETA